MIDDNELIEWAEYVDNYYGTPKLAVQQQLQDGKDVLLEIEMQGGMLVKRQFPDALLVFVAPPSADELQKRLIGRGTENDEQIQKRLKQAVTEVNYMHSYDYIVVNDEIDRPVEQIHMIIQNEHAHSDRCAEFIQRMESELQQFSKGD